jgi:hypothetical protein
MRLAILRRPGLWVGRYGSRKGSGSATFVTEFMTTTLPRNMTTQRTFAVRILELGAGFYPRNSLVAFGWQS